MKTKYKTIWITKNNIKIKIKNMSTNYLKNIILMIERMCNNEYQDALKNHYLFEPNGDIASYEHEKIGMKICIENYFPEIYYNMKRELKKRS